MIKGHANDLNRSEEVHVDATSFEMGAKDNSVQRENRSSDFEKDVKQENGESDYEPGRDSLSSQSNEDNKVKGASRVSRKLTRKESAENGTRTPKSGSKRQDSSKVQFKTGNSGQRSAQKPSRGSSTPKALNNGKPGNVKVPSKPPSELSEESDDKTKEDVKEIDVLDEAPICDQSVGTDDETVGTDENSIEDDRRITFRKIEEMEQKIDRLEEELREVAALEISLYSMVPEHGNSAHKVHTPARRLSRLYLHACKHWAQEKRATVAKNTVSGLVLIAKSCGNDVSRLTYWLSNTVVLREIISQSFGNLSHSNSTARIIQANGKKEDGKSPQSKWKNGSSEKQAKRSSFTQQVNDWQETGTFTAALEKIESWIFSRTVESVWWQTLTPHMQSPMDNVYPTRGHEKMLGPALGDQEQGSFSINLWNSAFHDAFTRLCPVRSGGHECGCLPVLARKVMEQCVSRLDVAMFNAILRESENDMPTDPVSDPIVDSKVLPIPAGDLSFGSGAQLKNSIGNWSRCLTDLFGMETEDCMGDEKAPNGDDLIGGGDAGSKSFSLLNELSDLLMLPKDMLIERSIRKEVCPSIGLSLITRILCNFTPDEFCPDPVPGIVLEELSAESLLERHPSEDNDLINSFPCLASPLIYSPPSAANVTEKVADTSGKANLDRSASIIQRKGYTSDEDLDDLDSPLTSIINKSILVEERTDKESKHANIRYKLLREVWSE
ncbi:uncharacterized protein A4U43_C01F21900 [Asparagus officinalis]|uniref:Dilute domain-containing protein n=1 Tax=Asparagus officinalis TaxID=4686 RepID=A0A5P1FVJ9_ASPOF|nr:uncharacterized protein LOC109827163 [Asparagus officinalis]XP_020249721.1 uncharacterized protein LOC109827163 [Asparagus officinalis]XP_020249727.1 uncharacterized protein LOC109827163 [Asparagus officinalis]ONK80800.1 uncharacterized protein A4U43_C01F21900 [Asparagus officinalis]